MRLVGTGEAPAGQYLEGQVFDASDAEAASLIERGWAKEGSHPDSDDAKREVELANAVVRGDTLANPKDAADAEDLVKGHADGNEGKDPHAIANSQGATDTVEEERDETPKPKQSAPSSQSKDKEPAKTGSGS